MATDDRLDPFPPVVLGSAQVLVDRRRPVAVLRGPGGAARVLTWPHAPLPAGAASAHLRVAPGCVWVVYTQHEVDPRAQPDDAPGSTAVRISAEGHLAWCQLGSLVVVGVDEVGVWACTDPYLAMGEPLAGAGEQPRGDGAVPAGAPEWVARAPVEAWEDLQRAHRQAGQVHVRAVTTAPAGAGEEEDVEWFTHSAGKHPPAPVPTGAVTLHRVRPDGQAEQVVASRVVSRVHAPRPGVLRVLFHPTGPLLTPIPGAQGYFYDYPQRVSEVDVSRALPATVDLDAAPWRRAGGDDAHDARREPAGQDERVDLSGVSGTRWHLRFPGDEHVAAATSAVLEQYAHLEVPTVVHTDHDDRWHRVRADYADVAVRVDGAWPHTEVVLDFTHRLAPDQLLRRRTRVFDHTGAPTSSRYLAVHLEESVATTDLARLPVHEGRREV